MVKKNRVRVPLGEVISSPDGVKVIKGGRVSLPDGVIITDCYIEGIKKKGTIVITCQLPE